MKLNRPGAAMVLASLFFWVGCSGPSRLGSRSATSSIASSPGRGLSRMNPPRRPTPTPKSPAFAAPTRSGWQSVGQSVQGRPIEAMRLGSGSDRVLVIGSVHGNEPEGVDLAKRLVAHLRGNPTLLAGRSLLVVRDANPDGNHAGSRTNARGVDLNRNFPARNWKAAANGDRGHSGSRPASEPETQALLKLLAAFRPQRIVSIHSTGGDPMVNYDGPAESLARAMSRHNRYPVSDYIGYPTPGSMGTYVGRDGRVPIITLELPRGINANHAWQQNRDALVEAIRFNGSGSPLSPFRGQPLPKAQLSR